MYVRGNVIGIGCAALALAVYKAVGVGITVVAAEYKYKGENNNENSCYSACDDSNCLFVKRKLGSFCLCLNGSLFFGHLVEVLLFFAHFKFSFFKISSLYSIRHYNIRELKSQ